MKTSSFSNILLLLVLFPYISLFNTPFDTQPFALIFSILLFLILLDRKQNALSFPLPLWFILLIFFYAIYFYLIISDWVYGYRSLAGYASIFFIGLASYKTFKYVNLKFYFSAISIWLIVGLMQLLVEKKLGQWLLPRMSTDAFRGVTSLAVEPSYYAIVCIFLLILNEIFRINGKYSRKLYFVIMLALSFQILISLSGMGLLFLAIFFFSKFISAIIFDRTIKNLSMLSFIVIIPLISILSFLFIPELQNTRGGDLLIKVIRDPITVFYTDGSVADRASHLLLSFYSLIYSHGVGLGLGTWNNYADSLVSWAGGWVEEIATDKLTLSGRIMSGWGSAIFELGIIGIFLIFIFLWIMLVGICRNKKMRSVYATSIIVIFFIMLMAVPLAFPLFGYTLGVFLYYSYADYGFSQVKNST